MSLLRPWPIQQINRTDRTKRFRQSRLASKHSRPHDFMKVHPSPPPLIASSSSLTGQLAGSAIILVINFERWSATATECYALQRTRQSVSIEVTLESADGFKTKKEPSAHTQPNLATAFLCAGVAACSFRT